MLELPTTLPALLEHCDRLSNASIRRLQVLDTHTGGEPTRLVLAGGPELGNGPLAERLERLRRQFPAFRTSVLAEPRGSDVLVGALLCAPNDSANAAGVLFFNDVGYLGMCGHGVIGLIHSLAYLGRLQVGTHSIETPVGEVEAVLHGNGEVTVSNVPSYRLFADVSVDVEGLGVVVGDVCWGGNWFFLASTPPPLPLLVENVEALTGFSAQVRAALWEAGVFGEAGAAIDHIEWFSRPHDPANNSRNFVLCPGAAYDRSPCGTGTSAKLASLAARHQLAAGEPWRQEGILGTVFSATYKPGHTAGVILPQITGRAYVTAESTLLFDAQDPFCEGILPGRAAQMGPA